MNRFLLACAIVLCGCSDSDDDGGGTGTKQFGEECTTVSNSSTECESSVCTNSFDQIGHPVCSQTCTYGMNDSCPTSSAGAKMCNMKGFCKP